MSSSLAKNRQALLYIALLQALIGTLGSLYFSEVMGFAPCVLCWYQRIAMYPIVFILGIGIYFDDKNVWRYALPLSVIGLGIGIYHNLLSYGVIPESVAPCTFGVSCTTKFIEWLGFITIPLLSALGFVLITACLVLYRQSLKSKEA